MMRVFLFELLLITFAVFPFQVLEIAVFLFLNHKAIKQYVVNIPQILSSFVLERSLLDLKKFHVIQQPHFQIIQHNHKLLANFHQSFYYQ